MKNFICVKKVPKKAINNLDIFDYVVIYCDRATKDLKIAIPDYNAEYTDNKSLYDAMNCNVAFFKKVNNLMSNDNAIGLFTDGNEITSVVGYLNKGGLIDSLDVSGQVLRKRLK